jgi:hypothetical protein
MQQAYYGLSALRQYRQDLRNPATRSTIESPYLNCHALLFQADGRYWLGRYLQRLSKALPSELGQRGASIGQSYLESSRLLKRFQVYNIAEGKSEAQIQEAIGWVDEAYRLEERLLGAWAALQARLE